jgi:glutathione S-transferase
MSYTIYYHGSCQSFYGRAWTAYAMLKHTGKEFECKGADATPPGVGFAPPFVGFPAGHTVSQSAVITVLVGKEVGLAPEGAAAEAKAQQLVADFADVATEITAGKPAERVNKWLDYVASQLTQSGFFFSALSYADFALYPVLEVLAKKQALGKCEGVVVPEKLASWYTSMEAIPAIAEMTASGLPILPAAYL